MQTRRTLLGTVGATASAVLSGCSGNTPSEATETPTTELTTVTADGSGPGGTVGAWRSVGGDAGNTSSNTASAGPEDTATLDTLYRQEDLDDIQTQPVAAEGVVVFVDDSGIKAVSPAGELEWEFRLGGGHRTAGLVPAFRDGTAYYPTADSLVAVRDGERLWEARLATQPDSNPVTTAEAVYLTTGGDQGTILSMRPDGTEHWRVTVDGTVSRPAVDGRTLFHYREPEYNDASLVARATSDGGVRWATSDLIPGSVVVAADGTVYTRRHRRTGTAVVARSAADGTVQWVSDVLTGEVVGAPLVTGGAVYVATTDGLRAFDTADGAEIWDDPYAAAAPIQSRPRVDGRSLYLLDDGDIVAVDRETGHERWVAGLGAEGNGTVRGYCPVDDAVYAALPDRIVSLA